MVKFKNRYGDKYAYKKLDENTILWTGEFKYNRASWDDEDRIIMIDPSGGPYIEQGWDMGKEHKNFSGMIVDHFKYHKDGYRIICKTEK